MGVCSRIWQLRANEKLWPIYHSTDRISHRLSWCPRRCSSPWCCWVRCSLTGLGRGSPQAPRRARKSSKHSLASNLPTDCSALRRGIQMRFFHHGGQLRVLDSSRDGRRVGALLDQSRALIASRQYDPGRPFENSEKRIQVQGKYGLHHHHNPNIIKFQIK